MVSSSLTIFIIAAVAATLAGTNAENFNVTNSSTDYYLLAQRDLLNNCDLSEAQISAVNARYADELSVLQLQQNSVLDEIQNVNKTYTELQALNIRKKHCIQKNMLQFVTYNSASSRFATCYATAANIASTLTRTATTDLTYARNSVLITLPRSIATCNTANPTNSTKLDECYIKEVTTATNTCNNYLANVRVDLNKSLYDASVAINTAVKCSFLVEKDVLVNMGQAQEAIQNCEDTFSQAVNRTIALKTPLTLSKLIGQ